METTTETTVTETTTRTAAQARDALIERLGWGHTGDPSVEIVEHEGVDYLVTSGTGDGDFAYTVEAVDAWLDATEGREPADEDGGWYQLFCDRCDPTVDADLAWAVHEETGRAICEPGICSPVVPIGVLERPVAAIETLAEECAAEALEQGAPARALTSQEDAGRGDYDALRALLHRAATPDELRTFRAAYSAALAAADD